MSVSPRVFHPSPSLLDICLTYRYGMIIFLLVHPTLKKGIIPVSFLLFACPFRENSAWQRSKSLLDTFSVNTVTDDINPSFIKQEGSGSRRIAAVLLRFFCYETKKRHGIKEMCVCALLGHVIFNV